jgi:hypothetical protein
VSGPKTGGGPFGPRRLLYLLGLKLALMVVAVIVALRVYGLI